MRVAVVFVEMEILVLINRIAEWLLSPFFLAGRMVGLILLSFVSAVILLLVFKKFSNQKQIRIHKKKIIGYFLEIGLYRDQVHRIVACQLNILKHNAIYVGYLMPPLFIVLVPISIVCIQINNHMGAAPLEAGRPFIIKATLDTDKTPGGMADLDRVSIKPSTGIVLETAPLRIAQDATILWRARITDANANQAVRFIFNGAADGITRPVVTQAATTHFSAEQRKLKTLMDFFYTAEERVPDRSIFRSVYIGYEPAKYRLLKWRFSPIVYYFILAIVFGFVLKPVIKVTV